MTSAKIGLLERRFFAFDVTGASDAGEWDTWLVDDVGVGQSVVAEAFTVGELEVLGLLGEGLPVEDIAVPVSHAHAHKPAGAVPPSP